MRLFTCTDHDCHWPVGVASIVIAPDEQTAVHLLADALKERGLKSWKTNDQGQHLANFTLREIPLDKSLALVLQDGNY